MAACLLLSCVPLCAQTVAVPQAAPPTPEQAIQEGLRRQEERSRELQRAQEPRSDELRPEAPREPAIEELEREPGCVVIGELALDGPDAGGFGWVLDAAAPYLRRCIGPKGLSFIAARLDRRLLDRGYATTRVSLPPQNLRDGRLLVRIDAGRVAGITMVQAGGPPGRRDDRWGTWRNAFPLSEGEILNVRDLEQGVENMKRLPSQDVTTRLEPGAQPGTSVVFIDRRAGTLRERLRGGATLDNSGGTSLGRAQLSANVALDNPSGLNDVLGLSFNTNAQQPTATHRSQSLSLNYSVPWGYSLLTLGTSNSRFAQYVQGTTVRFLSSGTSQSSDVGLQRTVWRSASGKLGVRASVSTRRAWSYLDDTELVVQRRRTTNAEWGVSYKHLFEAASFEGDVAYRRGMPWRAAQDDLDTAADGGATLRPKLWTFNAAYATEFKSGARPVQYSATLRGQFTRDTTLSVDQIAIGGRSSVRGFDGDAVLLAENGVILRNEFTTPLRLRDGWDTGLLFAVDAGRVWGPSDVYLVGRTLAGLAAGVRGRHGSLQFDATLATPLYRPSGFATHRLNFYLSLTQTF